MKTLTIILLCLIGMSCKKEQAPVLIPGNTYGIRGDIFNKGAYQPQTPVKLVDLFLNPQGIPYAHCTASVNWSAFALKPDKGVADQTIQANQIMIAGGLKLGDTTTLIWSIPQYDLQ